MPAANFLRSGKVSSFTDDNRDNAFQTNLLALNATADAAKNTAGLIEGIIKKIKDGSDLVTKTNEAFKEVSERSSKVGELVAEISAASSEQAHGIDQVNRAVTEMDKLTQQNAANAEESASASEEMNTQAVHMKTFVHDLGALVGGSGNGHRIEKGDDTPLKKISGVARNKINNSFAGGGAALKQHHIPMLAGGLRPDQVIPLDDDLKEF